MAEDKSGNVTPTDLAPPPLPTDPPPVNLDDRRKSLGLLKDITTSWPIDPIPRKYSLSESVTGCRMKEASAVEDLTKTNDDLFLTTKMKSSVTPVTPLKQSVRFESKQINPVQRKAERKGTDSPGPSSMPPTPNTVLKMSSMEEEAIRERLRTVTLRQISQILDDDSVGNRFTRDNFRRTFLNKSITKTIIKEVQDQGNEAALRVVKYKRYKMLMAERLCTENSSDLRTVNSRSRSEISISH